MDEIDKRYENGKIYTVKCKYDDTLIYVGSTIHSLCKRMGKHRLTKTTSLYQYVNGDWDNWYIELYEEYSCNNKKILEKREGDITKQIGTINKCIAGRTDKQYYKDNKEKLLEKVKEYYENNKEKIKDKIRENYENNKYKILEKKKQKVECDICKSIIRISDIARHKKTKKCLNYNVNNK